MANNLNVLYFIVFGSLLLNTATAQTLPLTTDTSTETVLQTTSPTPTPTEISTPTTTDAATTEEPEPTTSVLGPIIYEDCVQAQKKTCYDSVNRVYSIKARTEAGYAPLECMDNTYLRNCPGSGWTIVGNLNGTFDEPDTSFDSDAWTSKSTSYGFNPGFWSSYVGEVCFHTDQMISFVLPVHAPSLRSLFFGKKILDLNKDEFPGDFVDDCYEVGFNVGDPDFIVIRAGIVAVRNKTGCDSVLPLASGIGIFNVTSPVLGNAHGHLFGSNFYPEDFIIAVRSLQDEEPTGTSSTETTPGATEPTTSADRSMN